MTWPTLTLGVAFASDPLDDTPTYTDLTSRLFGFSTQVGREQNIDAFQPGTASLTLDNTDRDLDPTNAAGTYYGDLKPNKKLRLQATLGGTTYDVYHGHVKGWPVTHAGVGVAETQIACTDATKFLRGVLTADPYREVMEGTSPEVWFRFDEKTGTQIVDSSGNDRHGYSELDRSQSQVDPLIFGPGGALPLRGGSNAILDPAVYSVTGTSDFVISFWLRGTETHLSHAPLQQGNGYPDGGWTIALFWDIASQTTRWFFQVRDSGAANFRDCETDYGTHFLDGKPHLFTFMRVLGFMAIYIDGVDRTMTRSSLGANPSISPGFIEIDGAKRQEYDEFVVDEFAIHSPSLTDLVNLTAAGTTPWYGDRSGTRVGRLLDAISWPAALRNIDAGQSVLGAANWSRDADALGEMNTLATTEQGALFIDHADSGKVRYRDRATQLTATRATVSQATFSDTGAGDAVYSSIRLRYDDGLIVNQVTVQYDGGSVTDEDATSVTEHGPCPRTIKTRLRLKSEAQSLASWVLNHYKDAFLRVESVTINPAGMNGSAQTAAFTVALALQVGDLVTVEYSPVGGGSAISLDCHIEGIEHNVDNGLNVWSTTFKCSPAEIATYWIADVSHADVDTYAA